MTKRMLIDASHPEETRVVVLSGNRLEDVDFETTSKARLKGNIYLAKVTRVEPSLQAAFVDYGGNRHGFLAFNEIHPDYYRIPVADREALYSEATQDIDDDEREGVESFGEDDIDEAARRRPRLHRTYKIQEVIKRRQILLVQVVKEERGNKGAALTTYLSLAGRYCVLMPNTGRGGGISRKITDPKDRKRLRSVLSEIKIPEGMGVIVRTAGAGRTRAEIKRDEEYLLRLWDEIRERTLNSTAPALIHEEGNLITRSIRDLYTRDIDEVLVEGEEGYKLAKSFMKELTPSHAKRVQLYKNGMPLFHRFKVETQLDAIHNPVVQLRSGGYIVINPTEALVAIDVNSGKATRERHIEETALRTNLEAAEEIARQLRLRDLAGLVVIDFIDMEETRNQTAVERKLKESMRSDRARIQIGRISAFGLLELSRQRMRPPLAEASYEPCPSCGSSGYIRSVESMALQVLRAIEDEGLRGRAEQLVVRLPTLVALYILNPKRATLNDIEARYNIRVMLEADEELLRSAFHIERINGLAESKEAAGEKREQAAEGEARPTRGRRRRGRRREEAEEAAAEAAEAAEGVEAEEEEAEAERAAGEAAGEEQADRPKRRRRGKRGGRRRGRRKDELAAEAESEATADDAEAEDFAEDTGANAAEDTTEDTTADTGADTAEDTVEDIGAPLAASAALEADVPVAEDADAAELAAALLPEDAEPAPEPAAAEKPRKPARRRRSRSRGAGKTAAKEPADAAAETTAEPVTVAETAAETAEATETAWWRQAPEPAVGADEPAESAAEAARDGNGLDAEQPAAADSEPDSAEEAAAPEPVLPFAALQRGDATDGKHAGARHEAAPASPIIAPLPTEAEPEAEAEEDAPEEEAALAEDSRSPDQPEPSATRRRGWWQRLVE